MRILLKTYCRFQDLKPQNWSAVRLLRSCVAVCIGLTVVNCSANQVWAQVTYPFDLPSDINATLTVDTTQSRPVNKMLLGLNCNWPENLYGKVGYNHPDAQKLIVAMNPSSLRFPHGVWSNFYDWESDGRRITDDYVTPYDSSVKNHPELKYGFEGFHNLHQRLGFDVVLTFNVNYDSPTKAVRRLEDRRNKGFDVRWVELGNEPFWKTQRSRAIEDVEKYIKVSKAHSAALKAASPDLLVSIPVHWRTAETNPWNIAVKDHHYYDAITLHKHMGFENAPDGAAQTLGAREHMVQTGKTLRKIFPGVPIWVTEWSVSCGNNTLSVLAMADVYLGLFEHPELFAVASYFQINASHKLIDYDPKTGVHTRTSYGAAYEIVRRVFEGSEICASSLESTAMAEGLGAVSAVSVVKDGTVTLFAINKTPRRVPFDFVVDGVAGPRPSKHQAFNFDAIDESKTIALSDDVMHDVELDGRQAVLPPFSINCIEIQSNREAR
ncbi:hypothetical protein FHS27_005332 [Rhodopirellula rubra]|uniref:Non-reducing end alpha-L-arabinofuranosidase n=1 Tax=Aporhodopirellula rubra TaxID=980271 RepID=A0A7W5E541_9BACT|nr:hypothetical protein [Aporhodopirellula rubra]